MPTFSLRRALGSPHVWVPIVSILGGSLGGWVAASTYSLSLPEARDVFDALWRERPVVTTTTIQRIEVIPLESRPVISVYPAAFQGDRSSSVMSIVARAATKDVGDGAFLVERELGQAVAVTTDGWLVTASPLVDELRSERHVVWNQRLYPIQKVVRDTATGAVFLKINARDLPVTAFARSGDIAAGSAVWVEPSLHKLYPETVVSVRANHTAEPTSSERVMRRFLVSGLPLNNEVLGGAVWDGSGRLIGILEVRTAEGWQVLPASTISAGLSSLLNGGTIYHATLGVRAREAGELVYGSPTSTAKTGAWIQGDKRAGTQAIVPRGPSAGVLQEGDLLTRIERDTLDGVADLGERLLEYRPGTRITLYGERKGKSFEATVTLGSATSSEVIK